MTSLQACDEESFEELGNVARWSSSLNNDNTTRAG